MIYSAWYGPILAAAAAGPSTADLADQQWAELMLTTDSGSLYKKKGQPNTGHWGKAKTLRDQIKAASQRSGV